MMALVLTSWQCCVHELRNKQTNKKTNDNNFNSTKEQ